MNLYQAYQERRRQPLHPSVVKSTVAQIILIAEKKLRKKIKKLKVLDVGCGRGEYSREFAKYAKKVVAIEPYRKAYEIAVNKSNRNIAYHNLLVEKFQSKEEFDLVISLTTLEHMPNADASLRQIYKLMSKNSILYLTAPNKLWPYDNHYRLPFITWLPLFLADIYLKLMKKGNSYKDCSYSRTYFGVKSLLKKFDWNFKLHIPKKEAAYLGCGNKNFRYNFIKNIGIKLISISPIFWIFSKGFIFIVHKKALIKTRINP